MTQSKKTFFTHPKPKYAQDTDFADIFAASAKLELRATTTQERLRNHCENGMKSSIVLLLKNVWLFISYIRLTSCVSVLLDTGDSIKFVRRKFRVQRVKEILSPSLALQILQAFLNFFSPRMFKILSLQYIAMQFNITQRDIRVLPAIPLCRLCVFTTSPHKIQSCYCRNHMTQLLSSTSHVLIILL